MSGIIALQNEDTEKYFSQVWHNGYNRGASVQKDIEQVDKEKLSESSITSLK